MYLLGLADVVYKLDFIQSFAFGSLISAVDPVATLAIFQGEYVRNDMSEDISNLCLRSVGCGPRVEHAGVRGEHSQ